MCQSQGKTEKRSSAVNNDAIAGAIMIRIGAMIDFEIPSRPSAQFFKSSKPEMTSDVENRNSSSSGGELPSG